MKAPLSMGMEVPVKVMADDPKARRRAVGRAEGFDRGVGWRHGRRHAGHPEHLRGHRRRGGRRQYLADKAEPTRSAAKVAANDPAERLKKLSQLKDAGLVSDEEFETKKAEILSDL